MADEFRMIRLGSLLPTETIEAAFRDMERRLERGEDVSTIQKAVVVRLEPLRAELDSKGVLAEYLAWWLVWQAGRGVSSVEAPSAAFRPDGSGV